MVFTPVIATHNKVVLPWSACPAVAIIVSTGISKTVSVFKGERKIKAAIVRLSYDQSPALAQFAGRAYDSGGCRASHHGV